MISILEEARASDPGLYLSEEKLRSLEKIDHLMAARVQAARKAEQAEPAILKNVIETVTRKYDFASNAVNYKEKCYRDVGLVYRYCVFSMLCDDMTILENKLLFWLRTILQSQNFAQGNDSIRATYELLLKESQKQLSPEVFRYLDPFLARAVTILPSE